MDDHVSWFFAGALGEVTYDIANGTCSVAKAEGTNMAIRKNGGHEVNQDIVL